MNSTGTLWPKQVVHFRAKRLVHFGRKNQLRLHAVLKMKSVLSKPLQCRK